MSSKSALHHRLAAGALALAAGLALPSSLAGALGGLTPWALGGATLVAAGASGCGGGPCGLAENVLDGSIGETGLDVSVDKVRVRRVDTDLVAIEFKKGTQIHAKIVVDVRAFAKGVEIPLSDGQVTRITSPDSQYPRALANGSVRFESELRDGVDATGCFNVLFQMPDGSQRTLEGGFRAALEGLPE